MTEPRHLVFITTPEVDYLQDLLHSGLSQLLGCERILDLPFSRRIYFPRKSYPAVMVPRRHLSLRSRLRRRPLADAALVVVASCKPQALLHYQSLLPQLPADVPHVFIDGGDRRELAGDLDRLGAAGLFAAVEAQRPFDLVFKRELWRGDDHGRDCLPLQLGIVPHYLPPAQDPHHEVSFWCVESHPLRSRVLDLLAPHFDCVANGSVRGQTFRRYRRKGRRYLRELARCRIIINMPGAGWDCQRYWEAPAVGAAMVSPRPPIIIPHDFVDEQQIARCADDGEDVVAVCAALLADEERRRSLAAAGRQQALRYHSDVARAQALLDGIAQRCGVRL